MTAKYRGVGDKLHFTVSGADVVGGTTHTEADAFGVISADAAIGEQAVLNLFGEFEVVAESAETWAPGEFVYEASGTFSNVSGTNTLRGWVSEPKANGATVGSVILFPGLA